jgi:hypothetical protein
MSVALDVVLYSGVRIGAYAAVDTFVPIGCTSCLPDERSPFFRASFGLHVASNWLR